MNYNVPFQGLPGESTKTVTDIEREQDGCLLKRSTASSPQVIQLTNETVQVQSVYSGWTEANTMHTYNANFLACRIVAPFCVDQSQWSQNYKLLPASHASMSWLNVKAAKTAKEQM